MNTGGRQTVRPDVDRGWAWVALIACFWWNVIMGSFSKLFGIFYVEYLDLYSQGPTKTAWIMSSFSITFLLPLLVTGFISDHYNTRKLNMVLAVFCSLSFAMAAFAPNLTVTILTQGLFPGFFVGTIDAPFLGAFNKYFDKKRDLANTLAFCGGSFGGLALPYLMTWSIEKYTVRGSMLIYAGLWMQSVSIAAVLRPIIVPQDTKKQKAFNSINQPNAVHRRLQTTVWTVERDAQMVEPREESFGLKEYSKRSIFMDHLKEYKHLLKKIPVLLLIGATFLNTICFYCQLGIWPAYFEEIGFTKADAALLLSIGSLSEMVTRPVVGYLCTKFYLNKPVLVAVFGFVAAGLGLPVSFTDTKWIWCLYSSLFSIFGGIFVPLSLPMFVDIAGPEKSGTASALFLISLGLGSTVGPLMLGGLKEATGQYVYPLRVCLLLYTPAGILLILSTFRDSCFSRKGKERKVSTILEMTRL